jgi:ketosteroid isomerase-like protein
VIAAELGPLIYFDTMKNATNRNPAKKAAVTKKRRAAGKKAAATKKHRAAGKKAAETKKANLPAQKRSEAGVKANQIRKSKVASLDQIKYQMDVVNDLFNTDVVGKRRIDALDDVYTSNACILPPGSPMVSGREAIKNFWANLIQSANVKSVVLTSVDVIPSDEGVVEIGKATLTVEPPGQSGAQMEVKYVVYWKKEGGRWKWHVDIWNQNS